MLFHMMCVITSYSTRKCCMDHKLRYMDNEVCYTDHKMCYHKVLCEMFTFHMLISSIKKY